MVARHKNIILVRIKKMTKKNNKNLLGAIVHKRFFHWSHWLLVLHFDMFNLTLLLLLVCLRLQPGFLRWWEKKKKKNFRKTHKLADKRTYYMYTAHAWLPNTGYKIGDFRCNCPIFLPSMVTKMVTAWSAVMNVWKD